MIREKLSKQSWQVGDTVKVGFIAGLEVVKKIPTPGDWAPDAYALWQPNTGRFYRFVPHNGLHRCRDLADACAPQ
ncbi:MAG: hypothetical protein KGL35_30515 [Bradyrhizobium sp.]|nr:hypothetical protein [Bradyrhizobium sp.]